MRIANTRRRTLLVAATVVLLGAAGNEALTSAAAATAGPRARPSVSGTDSVTATWSLARRTADLGARIASTLHVRTSGTVRDAVVSLRPSGSVSVAGPTTISLGRLAAASTRRVDVTFAVRTHGTGALHATVSGRGVHGPVRGAVDLNVATGANRVVVSRNGLLEAQKGALRLQRAALGDRVYAHRLAALAVAGAHTDVAVGPAPSAGLPVNTTVSGTIRYTAVNDSKHPARTIVVQLRDADGTTGGTLVASGMTDAAGAYSLTGTTKRTNGTQRKLFIQAVAKGAGFLVRPVGSAVPHAIASRAITAKGAPISLSLLANKTADNNTAFDVADAITTAMAYTKHINGNALLGSITASYPNSMGTDFNSTTGVARILQFDRFDWDVILHEYGHFVADKFAIDVSPGGHHEFTQNLGETLGKQAGIRLAWSEGFATWFALTAEDLSGVAALAIPKAGDSFYDDTEDASFHVPLATNGAFASIGEDNELSVGRTLWHYRTDSAIAMSDTTMLTALKTAGATTLSAAVAALLPAGNAAKFDDSETVDATKVKHSDDFACVLTRQAVSPELTAPAANAMLDSETAPTFTWDANGAGPSNRLDQFTVQFWSKTWDKKIFESPQQATTTYTPTAADWKSIVEGKDAAGKVPPTLNIVVKGTGTNAPSTGPYKSCGVSVGVTPHITATPLEGVLSPLPTAPACTGLFPGDLNQFALNGGRLLPNTHYTLKLTLPAGGYHDVSLPAETSDADGMINNVVKAIPLMPADNLWQVTATPPAATGASTAKTTTRIVWNSCIVLSSTTSPDFTVTWGGAGVKPSTVVTELWNGVAAATTTSGATGGYQGSYTMHCPASSNTVSVNATLLHGTSTITFGSPLPCSPTVFGPSVTRSYAMIGTGSSAAIIGRRGRDG